MRLGWVTWVAAGFLTASAGRSATAQPDSSSSNEGVRRAVNITESSAVVLALECPPGAQPVWQPVRVYTTVALPELEWLGVGRTRICGVDVRGVETQVILACQRADGSHHGPVGTWYPSGEKRTEGNCWNGMAHGVWRRFRRDGWMEIEGRFERGAFAGDWVVWPADGPEQVLTPAELGREPPVF